nr:hypothetical protein [Janibacter melonis]
MEALVDAAQVGEAGPEADRALDAGVGRDDLLAAQPGEPRDLVPVDGYERA